MFRLAAVAILTLVASGHVWSPASFDANFTGATMRVDYFHTGGPTPGETIALDRVVNDGDWPGSRTQLIDVTNLGKYRFDVR
ncbi:MAG: peptidase M64 N-terminal domain-containing protein, partial [Vicinamibacterales bacterium]